MKKMITLGCLLLLSTSLFAQKTGEEREGKVSFISSQNIYVEFATTEGIVTGDTLWLKEGGKKLPAVLAGFTSSKSVAGSRIGDPKLEKGTLLYAYPSVVKKEEVVAIPEEPTPVITPEQEKKAREFRPVEKKNYRGRFSVSSYSDLSNLEGSPGYQRWRYSLSFAAEKINGSALSFSSYTTFSYLTRDWGREGHDLGRKLKVYDLKFAYAFDTVSSLSAGRFINRKISNIGAVDGALYERNFGSKWSGGVFIGSRPNTLDYGYNYKLFQTGLFVSLEDSIGAGSSENTIGFVNQTNDFKTDRRYIYLQHVSNPVKALSLFASSELDLYTVEAGEGKTKPDLTNFFVSARYAFSREYNVNISYDIRKNVIYYETFKTFIDSVLFNESLQGLRFGFNTTAIKNFSISLRAGFRNMGNDKRSSNDFGASIYWMNLPQISGSMNANISFNKSNYVEGLNYGINYSRNITENIYGSAGYRRIDYTFPVNSIKLSQNIVSLDLNYSISKAFNLGFNYEGVFESSSTYSRFFVDFTSRF